MGRRRTVEAARCFSHPGSSVVAVGRIATSTGVLQRYRCTPVVGAVHKFSVPIGGDQTLQALRVLAKPPACPKHPEGAVVRAGTYGKKTSKPRQLYMCTPAEGPSHRFAPPLPRDHVHEGEEHCEHCDELRGIHRGETAVARRHSWSTQIVVRGLEQLASGASYSEVSLWAKKMSDTNRTRTTKTATSTEPATTKRTTKTTTKATTGAAKNAGKKSKNDAETTTVAVGDDETKPKKKSRAASASRNAWHIAADWVEAFSPVIYTEVDAGLRARALAERARLDALIHEGKPLVRPQVVLIDDVPVFGRSLDGKTRSRRDAGYFVLVLAELDWGEVDDDEPFVVPDPTLKLRLVRVMAKSNTAAWRLVFDELGYVPDFLVADAGTGIAAAINAHFDKTRTKFIPSVWHLGQAVELALHGAPGAFSVESGVKVLVDPLAHHMRKLNRSSGVLEDVAAWKTWWDGLEKLLRTMRLPAEKVKARRKSYEPLMASVIPHIAYDRNLPVSTGGLETLIARQVRPLLAMRRTAFANIERTNALFDLVVAKQHGAFDRPADVAKLLRADAETHHGWSVPLRGVADPRPKGGSYSSLRDITLLATLAEQRGLT